MQKVSVGSLSLVLALGAAATSSAADRLPLGASAPLAETAMTGIDGKSTSVAAVKGAKGTLVVFTCNHCPYVKAWEGRIAELANRAAREGLGVVLINPNDPKKQPEDDLEGMKARATKLGLKVPYVVDQGGKVAAAYGATKTPEIFLFDAAGKLVYHGAVDDNSEAPDKVQKRYLADAIDALVAGKPIPVAETKALGCGIKYPS